MPLVGVPSLGGTGDGIVACGNPDKPVVPGGEALGGYRRAWTGRAPRPPLARCVATRTGLGGVIGQRREYFSWRFAVDFLGGPIDALGDDVEVEPVIEHASGRVEITSARPLHASTGYRAMFDLVRPERDLSPINLRPVLHGT